MPRYNRHQPSSLLLNVSCFVALLLACGGRAFAIDPTETLSELHRTRWTIREGAPAAMYALAQTSDGYLWIGAQGGLFRFDGDRFEAFTLLATRGDELDDQRPSYVFCDREGGLWLSMFFSDKFRFFRIPDIAGFVNHGYRMTPEQMRVANSAQSVPMDARFSMPEDREGNMWAATHDSLDQFRSKKLHSAAEPNRLGAYAQFSITPAYCQTPWFYTLCAFLILLALWQVYRMRVYQLAKQFQARMGVRLEERERIAGELHDTLLQSTQGLILLFQGFAGRVRDPEHMRMEMEVALDHADSLLNEVRDRVSDLRTTGLDVNIGETITRAGEELFAESTTKVVVVTTGTPRQLLLPVADNIYRVAREALTNAYAHAQAKIIEIEIAYEAEQFRLNVRDDGRGIDEEVLQNATRPNHFGLQGMRERARRCGGSLNIWSRNAAGTEIALKIPAKTAYSVRQKRVRWMPSDLFSRAQGKGHSDINPRR
jgi:signal transduction histidine kinase